MTPLLFRTPDPCEPFRFLELESAHSSDSARLASLFSEIAERRRGVMFSVPLAENIGSGRRPTLQGLLLTHTSHIWWDRAGYWREVITSGDHVVSTVVVTPDAMIMYAPFQETMYVAERLGDIRVHRDPGMEIQYQAANDRVSKVPLLNPRFPAKDWKFETLGEEAYLGRGVRRVRATRRGGREWRPGDDSGHWLGVEEYECVADDNLQILLSLVGLVDGAPVADVSMSLLRVDEPISSDVFRFSPPPGTRITRTPWLG